MGNPISDAWKNYVHDPLKDQWRSFTGQKQEEEWSREMWEKNYQMQKEFAQHGVGWKIEDAKKYGINPLAAIGAQGVPASPVTVGGPTGMSSLAGVNMLSNIIGMFAQIRNLNARTEKTNAETSVIKGQADAPNVGTIENPDHTIVPPEVEKQQKPGITAGNVPALGYMELPGKELKLTSGSQPIGVEEDVWQFAGKTWSIAKIWARSKYYSRIDKATRNRHGFTGFIRMLAQIYPSHNNYKGESWFWSLRRAAWISKPKNYSRSIWIE